MKVKPYLFFPILFIGLYSHCIARSSAQSANLVIIDPFAQEGDSMTLYIWEEYLTSHLEGFIPVKEYNSKNKNGKYSYQIESLTGIMYFTLTKGKSDKGLSMPLLEHYLIEPGDSIIIELKSFSPKMQSRVNDRSRQIGWILNDISFKGHGSSKHKCKYELNKVNRFSGSPLELLDIKALDSITRVRLKIINGYRYTISDTSYQLLKLDVIGRFLQARGVNSFDKDILESYADLMQDIPLEIKLMSKEYFESEFSKLFKNYTSYSSEQIYWQIKKSYIGDLKEKLITTFLLYKYSSLNNGEELVSDALSQMNRSFFRKILFELSEYLSEGVPAYNFSLPDPKGNIVKLSDFNGKVVVLDFWYNQCGACKSFYINQLSKVENVFKNDTNVVFVTINIDKDVKLWVDGINDGMHTSLEVVNLNTGDLGPDHPVIKHYKVIGYPRPMIIDRKGKIYKANGKDLRNAVKLSQLIESAIEKDKK